VEVSYSKSAAGGLIRSGKAGLLRSKIEQLAADPDSLAVNVKKLQGRSSSRLRVQDMRIVFRIEGDVLEIEGIGPRGEIYRSRS
jgi:mRNA interferase RelE/StbE